MAGWVKGNRVSVLGFREKGGDGESHVDCAGWSPLSTVAVFAKAGASFRAPPGAVRGGWLESLFSQASGRRMDMGGRSLTLPRRLNS